MSCSNVICAEGGGGAGLSEPLRSHVCEHRPANRRPHLTSCIACACRLLGCGMSWPASSRSMPSLPPTLSRWALPGVSTAVNFTAACAQHAECDQDRCTAPQLYQTRTCMPVMFAQQLMPSLHLLSLQITHLQQPSSWQQSCTGLGKKNDGLKAGLG